MNAPPIQKILLALPFLLWTTPTWAAPWYNSAFSAQIQKSDPNDPTSNATAQIIVGKESFRAQADHNGQQIVVIFNSKTQKSWTLNTGKKEFYEGVINAPEPPKVDIDLLPDDPQSNCNQPKGPTCTKVGQEKVNGIPADKWHIQVTDQAGQSLLISLWSDPSRKIILRQEVPNGPTMNRVLAGVENINNRKTEKWEITEAFQDKKHTVTKWIDLNLHIPIRIQSDTGSKIELSQIQEGSQPDTLFQVPADFKQIATPTAPQSPPAK
ncbi:MAG: hypothetical protein H7832_02655 [Magnetococcus sp. DMHC-6]